MSHLVKSRSKWLGSGKTKIDGTTFVSVGKEYGANERGVAIALGP